MAGIQLNPYAYAASNPLHYVDQNGRNPAAGAAAGAVGGTAAAAVAAGLACCTLYPKNCADALKRVKEEVEKRQREHEYCVKLFELCVAEKWIDKRIGAMANCALCLGKCEGIATAEGEAEWGFDLCGAAKKPTCPGNGTRH